MSLEAFRKALDELAEPAWCEGTYRLTERLAIALPDGDVAAADDATFVDWLVEHGEPAPYGHGGETKHDPKVRDAYRLRARDRADVAGFDPAAILDEIEATLSPGEHLDAKLTDVLVYRAGGRFARHKDTPRDPALVGTLVVGLPIAHQGGAFLVDNGGEDHVVDWSGTPDPTTLRWVAMFSDADHEIEPVIDGARVTLVYSLSRSGRKRDDATYAARMAKLDKLASTITVPGRGPLMIACSRHVITDDKTEPQNIDVLRGFDRDIADLLAARGFDIAVRSCVTAMDVMDGGDGEERGSLDTQRIYSISRLAKPLTAKAIAKFDDYCVTFAATAEYDGEEMPASSYAPYILDQIPMAQWVIRKRAAATLIQAAEMFSEDGYFGNEGYEAHIYTLAALEVTPGKRKAAAKPVVAPKKLAAATKKPAAKKPAGKKPAATKPAAKKPAAKKPAKRR